MFITACNERGDSPHQSVYDTRLDAKKNPGTKNYTELQGRPSASPGSATVYNRPLAHMGQK